MSSRKHLEIRLPEGPRSPHPRIRAFFESRKFLPGGSLYRREIEEYVGPGLKPVTITMQVRSILERNGISFQRIKGRQTGFYGISVDREFLLDAGWAEGQDELKKEKLGKEQLTEFFKKHPQFKELVELGLDATSLGLDVVIEAGQAAANARTKHVQASREHKRLLEEFGDLVLLEDATLFIRRFLSRTISLVRRQPKYASELAGEFGANTQITKQVLESASAKVIEAVGLFADEIEAEARDFRDEILRKRGDRGSGSHMRTKRARTGRPAS